MKILSMDMESCTGGNKDGSLCSFGYCISDLQFNIIEQKDIVINPAPQRFGLRRADIKLSYSENYFRSQPKFCDYYEQIKRLFTDVLVIGFDVMNDVNYLNNACDIYNLPRIKYKFIDVQLIYKLFKENKDVSGLDKASTDFGIEFVEHRSDDDAKATLLILKEICLRLNVDLSGIIGLYGLVEGINFDNKIMPSYSVANVKRQLSEPISNKTKNVLLNYFKRNLAQNFSAPKNFFYKKAVCFNKFLEYGDVNFTRKILKKLYDLGACYTSGAMGCNLFVYNKGEKKCSRQKEINDRKSKGDKIICLSEEDFFEKLGELEELHFDDVNTLIKHNIDRQEAKELLSKNQSF